jgi:hypothetical protein
VGDAGDEQEGNRERPHGWQSRLMVPL